MTAATAAKPATKRLPETVDAAPVNFGGDGVVVEVALEDPVGEAAPVVGAAPPVGTTAPVE